MIVASAIREARRKAVDLHRPTEGDDEWSLGCRAYTRTCFALRKAALEYPWLTVLADRQYLRFTFTIGGVPIRFYRGDPQDPPEKVFNVCYSELRQFEFAFGAGIAIPRDKVLRVAIETDPSGYASTISIVELGEDQKPTEIYPIPNWPPSQRTVVPLQPKGIDLPPPTVEPLKKDDEQEQRGKRDTG